MDRFTRIDATLNTTYHRWDVYYQSSQINVGQFIINQLSKTGIDRTFSAGSSIFINGKNATPETLLNSPGKVEFYCPRSDILFADRQSGIFNPNAHILYDEDGIFVAFKPARLHTLPSKELTIPSLRDLLETHFSCDIHLPSRLDFATQGLVIGSRKPETHNYVQRLFQDRRIKKIYMFASSKKSDWKEKLLQGSIARDPRHPVLRRVSQKGGQSASTKIKYLGTAGPDLHIYLAQPFTGRTHQIRVHAAHTGLPLIGDRFYNGSNAEFLHLLSSAIEFPKATDARLVKIKAPRALAPQWALCGL